MMNRHQAINSFHLDNDCFFDQKVQPVTTIQLDPSVDHGQGVLLFHLQAALDQLKSQAGFICRLQKARPQRAVHINSGADNALRDPV